MGTPASRALTHRLASSSRARARCRSIRIMRVRAARIALRRSGCEVVSALRATAGDDVKSGRQVSDPWGWLQSRAWMRLTNCSTAFAARTRTAGVIAECWRSAWRRCSSLDPGYESRAGARTTLTSQGLAAPGDARQRCLFWQPRRCGVLGEARVGLFRRSAGNGVNGEKGTVRLSNAAPGGGDLVTRDPNRAR